MNPFPSSEDAEDDDRRRRWLIEGKCTKPFLFAPSLWLRHILYVFTHTSESQSRHKAASSWSNQLVKTCWIDCLGFFCRSVVGGLVSMGIHSRRMDNVIFGCSQYSRHPPHRIYPNIPLSMALWHHHPTSTIVGLKKGKHDELTCCYCFGCYRPLFTEPPPPLTGW